MSIVYETTLYREIREIDADLAVAVTHTVVSMEHHFMENDTTGATQVEASDKARAIIAARSTA